MGKIIRNGIEFSSTVDTANNISYDNSLSGLEATTTQKAIDELNTNLTESLTAENSQAFQFAYDSESGKYGYKVKEADTDVFVPFKLAGIPRIVSISNYSNYSNYDKQIFIRIVLDISDCSKMITSTVQQGRFQHKYSLSKTTTFGNDTNLNPNTTYDLTDYSFMSLVFDHPLANVGGSATYNIGEILFE